MIRLTEPLISLIQTRKSCFQKNSFGKGRNLTPDCLHVYCTLNYSNKVSTVPNDLYSEVWKWSHTASFCVTLLREQLEKQSTGKYIMPEKRYASKKNDFVWAKKNKCICMFAIIHIHLTQFYSCTHTDSGSVRGHIVSLDLCPLCSLKFPFTLAQHGTALHLCHKINQSEKVNPDWLFGGQSLVEFSG